MTISVSPSCCVSLLSLSCLLTACAHQPLQPSNLRAQIVGMWWFDDYNPAGPFDLVTFYPDGRFSSSNPRNPGVEHNAYWRVEADGTLLITRTKDALPNSNAWNDDIFVLDHMTGTEMVFAHPSVAGRMTFRKVTSDTKPTLP